MGRVEREREGRRVKRERLERHMCAKSVSFLLNRQMGHLKETFLAEFSPFSDERKRHLIGEEFYGDGQQPPQQSPTDVHQQQQQQPQQQHPPPPAVVTVNLPSVDLGPPALVHTAIVEEDDTNAVSVTAPNGSASGSGGSGGPAAQACVHLQIPKVEPGVAVVHHSTGEL